MKSITTLGLSLAAISTLGFVGCGGGGSSAPADDTQTGTFVDSPVQGLNYLTAAQSGVTDSSGNFKYKTGETVTFKIGNLTLGSVNAKKTITPLTLGGDNSLNTIGTKSINIARILQSLDDNPSNTSIIVIPTSLQDLNVTNIDLLSDADLNTVLTQSQAKTSKTYTLKSAVDAENEMKSFLKTYLYVGSYTATSVYSSSSTLQASQCGGTLQWSIQIANNGAVTGTSTTEGNRAILGITISDSRITGIANDGTTWNVTINEDGIIGGTYNWGNGQCVGTISGTKN